MSTPHPHHHAQHHKKPVHTGANAYVDGSLPPPAFIDELVEWARTAPDELFAQSANSGDVYASVSKELGPYGDMTQRRAVMLEVLRVLAEYESGWDWNHGIDEETNPDKDSSKVEAGPWQVSADSANPHNRMPLYILCQRNGLLDPLPPPKPPAAHPHGKTHPPAPQFAKVNAGKFQAAMKQRHRLSMEYITRLLRITVAANGPILFHKIHHLLSREAVTDFQGRLSRDPATPDTAVVPGTLPSTAPGTPPVPPTVRRALPVNPTVRPALPVNR